MKNSIFRPAEFWKSAVMTMPDNSFFELMRSVFGKIKTPFNKQQLINDLETFLLREDIQKTITSYINQNDVKIIAAVAVLDEPVLADIETFFESELNNAQLQDIIVNLEERFILYRFSDDAHSKGNAYPRGNARPAERISRLALNPVLEQILLPFTADISPLFQKTAVEDETDRSPFTPVINDRILAALFSFVTQNKSFYRSEGVMRKRTIEAGKTHFPGIDLYLLLGSLQILGLFYVEADNLIPDKKRFEDFCSLSARERSEYCAAALLVYDGLNSSVEILHPLFRHKVREIINFIHGLLDQLEINSLYPEHFIKRLIKILGQKTKFETTNYKLLEALEKTGLLATESQRYKFTASKENTSGIKHEGPFIAIDSGASVLVYPEIDFADALKLAEITNIQEARTEATHTQEGTGEVVRFEIDRDTIVRAFDNNISADEIVDLLKRLSANRVDDALIWNIKDWEKRYNEVSLKKGVVLTLSEERRYLVETMPLKNLISETLAPGLYLLPENVTDRAAAALQAAGIDIIAQRNEKSASNFQANEYFPPPSSVSEKILPVSESNFSKLSKHDNAAAALDENFHEILKKLSMSETGRAELSARIDRRLILCEDQLKEANVRYEKLEARHMDYAGKQNIAKQAIAQKSPVEIIWRSAGKEKSLMGIPDALEKEEAHSKGNGELVLIINAKDENLRIPLAKISLLRRIKKSIFEV